MKRVEILDVYRFVAAVGVVLFHYLFNGIRNSKISTTLSPQEFFSYFYLGVDFFFLISGYVIFYSALNKAASQFAVSRFVRLFPAFWAAALFTSFFAFLWPGTQLEVGLIQLIVNLTMISPVFGVPYVDGVYWTLAYELSFYAVIFAALFLGFGSNLEKVFKVWLVFCVVAHACGYWNTPLLSGYHSYFLAGAALAQFNRFRRKIDLFFVAGGAYAVVNFATIKSGYLAELRGSAYSQELIALIIISFIVSFLLVGFNRIATVHIPFSRFFGSITYPLYLIHAHVGYIMLSSLGWLGVVPAYCIVIMFILLVAVLIHFIVEKGLAGFWYTIAGEFIAKPVLNARKLVGLNS